MALELTEEQIKAGWTIQRLGDLGEIFDGPHATAKKIESGPYYLSISSLVDGRLALAESAHISEEDFSKWTKRVTPIYPDLLFSYETKLGSAALMPRGVRASLGRRMGLIRFDTQKVNPHFMLYKWLSPEFQRYIQQHKISGATVERIALSELGKWEVALPPKPGQDRIAEILGSLDDKIEANNALIDSLSELAIAEVERLEIFSGEADGVLEDIIEFSPKVAKPVGDFYQFVDMSVLPTSGPVAGQTQVKDKWTGSKFVEGDTLFSRITPCLENGKTALAMGLGSEPAVGSTEFIVMRARGLHRELLAYGVARSRRFREIATQKMTGTSGRQRVKWQDLAIIPVSTARLDEFALGATEFDLLRSLREENIQLAKTRDLLIRQLIG